MIQLANSLEEEAQGIDQAMKSIENQAKATTWNGGARQRFDAELQNQLKKGKELAGDLLNAAHELRKNASKYRAILAGLDHDEKMVRKALDKNLGGPVRAETVGSLPCSRDPRWADLALELLKHSEAVDAGLKR